MRIQLSFDIEALELSVQRKTNLVFGIAWEHNDVFYPASNWIDFGTVILPWWLRSSVELFEGAHTAEFLFMDGPYGFRAEYDRKLGVVKLLPRGQEWIWSVELDVLARELVKAANIVSRQLYVLHIGEMDRQSLEYGVAKIRSTILAKT